MCLQIGCPLPPFSFSGDAASGVTWDRRPTVLPFKLDRTKIRLVLVIFLGFLEGQDQKNFERYGY